MIIYLRKKVTANELAKLVVCHKGEVGADYWTEDVSIEHDLLTDREIESINEAMSRQVDRVRDFLGIDYIWEKRRLRDAADPEFWK